jgi:hypothetical protein
MRLVLAYRSWGRTCSRPQAARRICHMPLDAARSRTAGRSARLRCCRRRIACRQWTEVRFGQEAQVWFGPRPRGPGSDCRSHSRSHRGHGGLRDGRYDRGHRHGGRQAGVEGWTWKLRYNVVFNPTSRTRVARQHACMMSSEDGQRPDESITELLGTARLRARLVLRTSMWRAGGGGRCG